MYKKNSKEDEFFKKGVKLDELNQMHKSGLVNKEEYNKLLKGILDSKVEPNIDSDNQQIEHYKTQRIKNAGSNVIGIYYLIIFEIILNQIHSILLDVKIEYFKKINGISESYSEINSMTKFILNTEKIDDFIKNLEYLDLFFYLFQFILFSMFLNYFWNLGKNLKNVDKRPE
jgi:hypothetical protein